MKKAVVLLSGGLDSATVLAIAKSQDFQCFALSFDYGQRHNIELEWAKSLAKRTQVKDHLIVKLQPEAFAGSALTDTTLAVPEIATEDIPITYVPARNTVFLAYALGWSEVIEASHIFIGVNAVDYSGYPDCRPEYIDAFNRLATFATKSAVHGKAIEIKSPLIEMTKSEIIRTGTQLGVDYSKTSSCYAPSCTGLACGKCDSCRIRAAGFAEAGYPDPTRYQD